MLLRHAEPTVAKRARWAITSFVLRQPTGHPDYPGLIIDYIATIDFKYTFTEIHEGTIEASIEATASAAGSA